MIRSTTRQRLYAFTACLGLSLTANAWGQDFQTVALTGDQAPGAEPGVVFSFLGLPVINPAGQTAFSANLSRASSNNNSGIYSDVSGTLAQVVREGDQAPGADPGVVFSDFSLSFPSLNAAGQIAFSGSLTGAGVDTTNDSGIYSEDSGTLAQVARAGGQAPGADPGVVFSSFGRDSLPAFNPAGQTAFRGDLTGTGVDATNDSGIYSEGSGTLTQVARAGGQAPGADPGVVFSGFNVLSVLNAAGQTAFEGFLTGTGVDFTNDTAIYSEGSGTLAQVARAGDQAPGADPGVVFRRFNDPVLNAAGQTAFEAGLDGEALNSTNNSGIYSEGSGTLAQVAREGGQAPGAAPGVVFDRFGAPVLNAAGQTAFSADLDGTGVDRTNDSGIYSEGSGTLAQVARTGDQAPGANSGVVFAGFGRNTVPVINAAGQTAFTGFLTGAGVDGTNGVGIYATDLDGQLIEIARAGDVFDVNNDPLVEDLRTISDLSFFGHTGNEDGVGSSFNDLGQLVFAAFFTDDSEGIFVSNLVAVPEPASLAFLALSGVSLLSRRRRRA